MKGVGNDDGFGIGGATFDFSVLGAGINRGAVFRAVFSFDHLNLLLGAQYLVGIVVRIMRAWLCWRNQWQRPHAIFEHGDVVLRCGC